MKHNGRNKEGQVAIMAGDEIELNLKNHVFYHGVKFEIAERIVAEGFRVPQWETTNCPDGPQLQRVWRILTLGGGLYITCNWKTAMHFGCVLLRVSLARGTRILNAGVPPDRKILDRLRREFGHRILDDDPRKVLPRNKQLLLPELVALARHHFREAFYSGEGFTSDKWDWRRSGRHMKILKTGIRTIARHYKFAGIGNHDDRYGIVVFISEHVVLEEILFERGVYHLDNDNWESLTLDQFRKQLLPFGTTRAARLAERFALLRAGRGERIAKAGPPAAVQSGTRSVTGPPADWRFEPDVLGRPELMKKFGMTDDTIRKCRFWDKWENCELHVVRKRLTPDEIRLLQQAGGQLCGDDEYKVGRFLLNPEPELILVECFMSCLEMPREAGNGPAVDLDRIEKVTGKWLHAGCVLLLELSRALDIPLAVTNLLKRGKDDRWELVDYFKMREVRLRWYTRPVMVAPRPKLDVDKRESFKRI